MAFDYKYVKEYVESFGYKLISKEYKTCHEKLEIECQLGHLYEVTFTNFKNHNKRCPVCNGGVRFTLNDVKSIVEKEGYTLLEEEYKNARTKMNVMCNNGHKLKISFDNFNNKNIRCQFCSGKRKVYEEVKNIIESEGYKLISSEYINIKEKLDISCPRGHEYKVNFHNFIHGRRCPVCNQSTGEVKIEKILRTWDIRFVNQFKFKDCKDIRPLPFDFYLTDYNMCIEYDGIQHYKAFDFFGGEKRLQEYKRHDKLKNKFCKQNNILILRIPYWDFNNIENILKENLIVNLEETSTTKKPLKSQGAVEDIFI